MTSKTTYVHIRSLVHLEMEDQAVHGKHWSTIAMVEAKSIGGPKSKTYYN